MDGTEGQDRESYTDEQDRKSYVPSVQRPERRDVKRTLEDVSNSFWDFSSFARLISRITAAIARELGLKDPEIDNRPVKTPEWLEAHSGDTEREERTDAQS